MAFWAFGRLQPPYRVILLATMVWTFAITPLIGVFELGDDIGAAVATTGQGLGADHGACPLAACLRPCAPGRRP